MITVVSINSRDFTINIKSSINQLNNRQRILFSSFNEVIALLACANKQQTAHSALGCLVSLGLENWTVEEIKGLQGQEKNEYCR